MQRGPSQSRSPSILGLYIRQLGGRTENMKRRKKPTRNVVPPMDIRSPESPEEVKRREHEQGLEDFRYAARRVDMERRLLELVLAERAADQQSAKTAGRSDTGSAPSVGSNLARFREECSWTIEELAEKVELDRRTVFRHLR